MYALTCRESSAVIFSSLIALIVIEILVPIDRPQGAINSLGSCGRDVCLNFPDTPAPETVMDTASQEMTNLVGVVVMVVVLVKV